MAYKVKTNAYTKEGGKSKRICLYNDNVSKWDLIVSVWNAFMRIEDVISKDFNWIVWKAEEDSNSASSNPILVTLYDDTMRVFLSVDDGKWGVAEWELQWNQLIEIVWETINAIYDDTYKLYRFLNYDEVTVLQWWYVKDGETPVYTWDTPTKPDTEEYHYTFTWWNPTVWPITSNTDYIAQYSTQSFVTITIKWWEATIWTLKGISWTSTQLTPEELAEMVWNAWISNILTQMYWYVYEVWKDESKNLAFELPRRTFDFTETRSVDIREFSSEIKPEVTVLDDFQSGCYESGAVKHYYYKWLTCYSPYTWPDFWYIVLFSDSCYDNAYIIADRNVWASKFLNVALSDTHSDNDEAMWHHFKWWAKTPNWAKDQENWSNPTTQTPVNLKWFHIPTEAEWGNIKGALEWIMDSASLALTQEYTRKMLLIPSAWIQGGGRGEQGEYWSATPTVDDEAYQIAWNTGYGDDNIYINTVYKGTGNSLRLISNIQLWL